MSMLCLIIGFIIASLLWAKYPEKLSIFVDKLIKIWDWIKELFNKKE